MPMTTGETIRRIRRSIGMTQAELGALLHFTQPAISQLEHDGPASYDLRVLRRVAKALQVPLTVLVAESDEEADMRRRQFFKTGVVGVGTTVAESQRPEVRTSASSGPRVGAADVDRIMRSIDKIHELQLMAGGDRLCEIATNEVRYVEQLLDIGSYSDKVGKALTSAGAEMMTAAGWVHYDAGRWKDAKRYYADAAQAATVSGDGIAAAHTWINACLLSYREGSRPKEGVQLAQAAQLAARREGGPKLRALAAIREAEALSVIGDRAAMVGAVNRAHRAYESTRGHDPAYLAHLPEAQLSGLTGLAFMRLGDHSEAATYLQSAIDGTAAYPREQIAWQIRLAQNFVQAGAIADGCGVLIEHFAGISTVASTRLQTTLSDIADELRRHVAVAEVREFFGLWTAR
ncbi:helix-turn-helix domain-containing protein [Nocardia bovistercoris]|uniref:Helix-turn-helix transcriptional regulator n=1 Tax=Nocardia bovistercoris TaxID=2785916 RepID=A0A931IHX8_9NOCA|nr:helix-turn-helix transcriptional regulator [Nocardia bovistercoris]MBH0779943.1 helix-turn-helix transcriptional regulator [Nocardia bovistercoris]